MSNDSISDIDRERIIQQGAEAERARIKEIINLLIFKYIILDKRFYDDLMKRIG